MSKISDLRISKDLNFVSYYNCDFTSVERAVGCVHFLMQAICGSTSP